MNQGILPIPKDEENAPGLDPEIGGNAFSGKIGRDQEV